MKYIECPSQDLTLNPSESIFLAGSITGTNNWQKQVAKQLLPEFNVFNPRRENFNVLDPLVEKEQITWEFKNIQFCNNILFWFSYETVAPITLFEYGKVLATKSFCDDDYNIFVGVHPNYSRLRDVIIQTELEQPEIKIVFSLSDLVAQVIKSKKV